MAPWLGKLVNEINASNVPPRCLPKAAKRYWATERIQRTLHAIVYLRSGILSNVNSRPWPVKPERGFNAEWYETWPK
jgi:hypothetical protein